MFRLIPLLFLLLLNFGCATTGINGNPATPPAIVSAQNAAQDSLYAIGTAMQATPGILNALYDAGKLSKTDYNNAVPVFNQALASFQLAVTALKAAKTAEQDPNTTAAYVTALKSFLDDKNSIDNLMTAFGKKPIGASL